MSERLGVTSGTAGSRAGVTCHDGEFRQGVQAGAPLALPMALIGVSFGLYARASGWPTVDVVAMSLANFSGAGQIAAVAVLAAHGTVAAAVGAGAVVNLRFLPIGIVVGPSIRGCALRRALVGQALLDASLVLARVGTARYSARRLLGSSAPQWLAWQLGTVVGAIAPAGLGPARYGVDALFPAFFCVLLVREARSPRGRATALLASLAALGLTPVLPAGLPVVIAAATTIVTGLAQ